MKNAIMGFLRTGCYKGSKYSPNDFIGKLDFLALLIKDSGQVKGVYANDNWFWSFRNQAHRAALVTEIDRIKHFNDDDPSYNYIMGRFKNGNGYGVMFPVRSEVVENVNSDAFDKAVGYYVSKGTSPWNKVFNDSSLRYKLVYCCKKELPMLDIEEWDLCEKLVSSRLNYQEYKIAYSTLYGSPFDLKAIYMTTEYYDSVLAMKEALKGYGTGLKAKSQNLVTEIMWHHNAGDIQRSSALLDELKSYYEHREGASKWEKDEQDAKLKLFTSQIPVDVVTAIMDFRAKAVA